MSSQRHIGTEGPYASASVTNVARYPTASADMEAANQRPASTLEIPHRSRSGSRNETASQMVVSERPQSTTISKVTRSRSLSSKPAAAAALAVRPANSLGPRSVHSEAISQRSSHHSQKNSSTTKAGVVVETMSAPNPVSSGNQS